MEAAAPVAAPVVTSSGGETRAAEWPSLVAEASGASGVFAPEATEGAHSIRRRVAVPRTEIAAAEQMVHI